MSLTGIINRDAFVKAAKHIHKTRLSKPYTRTGDANFDMNQRLLVRLQHKTNKPLSVQLSSKDLIGCFDPATGEIDRAALSALENGKYKDYEIAKIKHRPNHGLDHSAGAAILIPVVAQFKQKYVDPDGRNRIKAQKYNEIKAKELIRLQMMALFSVSGREDETGFHGDQEVYKQFRIKSAIDYFDYFIKYSDDKSVYDLPSEMKKLIHDAVIVELMGNPTIRAELLEEKALGIVEHIKAQYSGTADSWLKGDGGVDGAVETGENIYLELLNNVHSLELLRVYGNVDTKNSTTKKAQSTSRSILPGLMGSCKSEGLEDAIKILVYARDIIQQRGDRLATNLSDEKLVELGIGDGLTFNSQHPEVRDLLRPLSADDMPADRKLVAELLSGKRQEYQSGFFEHCHYHSRKPDESQRDIDTEVDSTVYDIEHTPVPALDCLEERGPSVASEASDRYFIKVIPPYGLDSFLAGQFEEQKIDLRINPKQAYTILFDGVRKSRDKSPTLEDKTGFTQHQSVSMIAPRVSPQVFSVFSRHATVGVRYNYDAVEINRMLLKGGTVRRYYDFKTKKEAVQTYERLQKEGLFFSTVEEFEQACEQSGSTTINEVLAYLKWVEGSSFICVFKDNLASRLMAQEYARRTKVKTDAMDGSTQQAVPIKFYIRYSDINETTYEKTAQNEDILEAKRLYDSEAERIRLLEAKDYEFLLTEENAKSILVDRPEICLELIASDNMFILESILNMSGKKLLDVNIPGDSEVIETCLQNLYALNHKDCLTEDQKEIFKRLLIITPKENATHTEDSPFANYITSVFKGEESVRILKEKGLFPSPGTPDKNGMTAIMTAFFHGDVSTYLSLCREAGPDVYSSILDYRRVADFHWQTFKNGVIKHASHDALVKIMGSTELPKDMTFSFVKIASRNDRDKLELIKMAKEQDKLVDVNLFGIISLFSTSYELSQLILAPGKFDKIFQNQDILSSALYAQIGKREVQILKYLIENDLVPDDAKDQVLGLCLLSGHKEAIAAAGAMKKNNTGTCIPRLGEKTLFELYALGHKTKKMENFVEEHGLSQHVQDGIRAMMAAYQKEYGMIKDNHFDDEDVLFNHPASVEEMINSIQQAGHYQELKDYKPNILFDLFKQTADFKPDVFSKILEMELKELHAGNPLVFVRPSDDGTLFINCLLNNLSGDNIPQILKILVDMESQGIDVREHFDTSNVDDSAFMCLYERVASQYLSRNFLKDKNLINIQSEKTGHSLLVKSILSDDPKKFQALLDIGANIELGTKRAGTTPIMLAFYVAMQKGSFEPYVTGLLEKGADPLSVETVGGSVFHIIMRQCKEGSNIDNIKMVFNKLNELEVNVTLQNKEGKTALDLAKDLDESIPYKKQIIELLETIELKQSQISEHSAAAQPSQSREKLHEALRGDDSPSPSTKAEKNSSSISKKP